MHLFKMTFHLQHRRFDGFFIILIYITTAINLKRRQSKFCLLEVCFYQNIQ